MHTQPVALFLCHIWDFAIMHLLIKLSSLGFFVILIVSNGETLATYSLKKKQFCAWLFLTVCRQPSIAANVDAVLKLPSHQ